MRLRISLPLLTTSALVAIVLSACSGSQAADRQEPAQPTEKASTDAPEKVAASLGPVETFERWLAASRLPDAPLACSLMTDDLVAKMDAEFAASLGVSFASCEDMIAQTAAMYAATGASAEVDVRLVSETASSATLFATYVGSSKCGTIVLEAEADGWVINEQSEECNAG